jgi:UDP-2-acetamido-3-amino-2,3-dideoxy-glucuronate N-acetyltransferase
MEMVSSNIHIDWDGDGTFYSSGHTKVRIHPTAEVSLQAEIGEGTTIWHQAQVREGARIGRDCTLSKGVYIDTAVSLGDNVKVQNYVSIYHGVTIEDGVFCGPHCVFTNDKRPRAISADGSLKAGDDWKLTPTLVKRGASIGANAVIVCGVTIGEWAMVGSGTVVSRNVPDYGLVWGNPVRLQGFVCPCGQRLEPHGRQMEGDMVRLRCPECEQSIRVRKANWEQV